MPEKKSPEPVAPSRLHDWLYAIALLGFTGIVFWPAARWLTSQTFAREQLKQSFFIVLLAGLWIAWEKRQTLRVRLQFSNMALRWLFASYVLAGGAIVFKNPLLFLAGMVAAVAGFVNYVFGGQAFRRTLPLLSVFTLLILSVLIFPVLDWPLRQMAGVEAAHLLKFLGFASQLVVSTQPDVKLLLYAGGQTFVVATECNGFGMITSSLLLGLILLLYRRARWWRFALLLPLCVGLGFVFNFLRICSIVLLAPTFPTHYSAMHETAGIVALYSGLGLVWLVTGWRPTGRFQTAA